jgi:hypothetical protein
MPTTSKGAPYPAATSANDVPADIQALANWLDARPGVSPLTTAARDALTGADLWDGRVIYNLTTAQLERYNATLLTPAWQSASITDHGGLTGLGDDDHVQYLLKTDNLAALTNKAAARENLGANAAYAAKAGATFTGLVEAAGDLLLPADRYLRFPSAEFFAQTYTGTTDASGQASFSHGVFAAHSRVVVAGAFYRNTGGDARPMSVGFVDGATAVFTGALAGVLYRATLLVQRNAQAGW